SQEIDLRVGRLDEAVAAEVMPFDQSGRLVENGYPGEPRTWVIAGSATRPLRHAVRLTLRGGAHAWGGAALLRLEGAPAARVELAPAASAPVSGDAIASFRIVGVSDDGTDLGEARLRGTI